MWDVAAITGAVGVACTLGGGWLASFVKDRSRETAKQQFQESIKAELAIFRTDLMTSLNGTYLRSELAREKFGEMDRRLERIEARVGEGR
jgi:hypothetical protein